MENADLTPHASVLSQSALHAFITGPNNPTPPAKSSFNPYRKKSGLLNLVSLEAAEVALVKSIGQEEPRSDEDNSGLMLTGAPAT